MLIFIKGKWAQVAVCPPLVYTVFIHTFTLCNFSVMYTLLHQYKYVHNTAIMLSTHTFPTSYYPSSSGVPSMSALVYIYSATLPGFDNQ